MQRIGNCSECGHWDPFHPSWYTPEKEVAELTWVEDWFPGLIDILKEGNITVEHQDGDWVYHITFNKKKQAYTTVERWPVAIDKVGFSPQERSGRKNHHLNKKPIYRDALGFT